MSWNYAELSSAAKSAGGPELFVQSLIDAGKSQMIMPMCSLGIIGVGAGITIGFVSGIKLKKYYEKMINEMTEETVSFFEEYINLEEKQNVGV